MAKLKGGRGLFGVEPVQVVEGSAPEPNDKVVANAGGSLPWSPRSIAIKDIGRKLGEVNDQATVRMLAAADGRKGARSHYELRLAELEAGAGSDAETQANGSEVTEADQGPGDLDALEIGGEDDMLRITVYATLDQIEYLDDDRRRIRRAYRVTLDRTAIIRGLLEGYRRSGLDLVRAGVRTEEGLAEFIAGLLTGGSA